MPTLHSRRHVADDPHNDARGDEEALPFKRHLVAPSVVLTLLELFGIVLPVYSLFNEGVGVRQGLTAVVVGVVGVVELAWLFVLGSWFAPIWRATAIRRRGGALDEATAAAAYRAMWRLPFQALVLRTALWATSALMVG